MTFTSRFAVLWLFVISTAIAVPLHAPHKPGTMAVALVKEDNFLTFVMAVTSQDLLGFEGSPAKLEQKEKLAEQYAKLYKEESLSKLFKFLPADACWPYSADMESEMLDYHEHPDDREQKSDPKDIHKVGDEEGRSDFELRYTFVCDKTVDVLQMTFHEVFPSIQQVDFYGKGELSGDVLSSVPADEAFVVGKELE